jgi:hypothetical protein
MEVADGQTGGAVSGAGGPSEPFDAEEAEVPHTLEGDIPGQPSSS